MKNIGLFLYKGIRGMYYYIVGNFYALYVYDRKYLCGRWFYTRWHGIGAEGWEWVVKSHRDCKKIGVNSKVRWPVSSRCRIVGENEIIFDPDDLNNFQSPGCYFQCMDKIEIGKGSYIGPNVGIITANHSIQDLNLHEQSKPVIIGKRCWIGMNSVILPGVKLGEHTIVGAGSVVTKSFLEGECVIAGNPAKLVKKI